MNRDCIHIVDDDADIRDSLRLLLGAEGFTTCAFASADAFLSDVGAKQGCLIADVRMPGMSGLELLEEIRRRQWRLPVIMMTGHADIPLAVRAMKAGAVDFLEKPFSSSRLTESLHRALELGAQAQHREEEAGAARNLLTHLSSRERMVLDRLVQGAPNKIVAHELGISARTVEIHRAHIMLKMDASNLADLVRAVLTAQSP
jgi:two-component system response regulator FixJ